MEMSQGRAALIGAGATIAAALIGGAVAIVVAVFPEKPPKQVVNGGAVSSVDPCVVGTWSLVRANSIFEVDGRNIPTSLQSGSMSRVSYAANGSGNSTSLIILGGSSGTDVVAETMEAESSFTFTTNDGKIARSGQYRNSKYTYTINGKESSPEPMTSFPDVVKYVCSDDRLEHQGTDYTFIFSRLSK